MSNATFDLTLTDTHRVLALRGPNLWCRVTALEAWVDFTLPAETKDWHARLSAWLPRAQLTASTLSVDAMAVLIAQITLELQRRPDLDLSFTKIVPTSLPDRMRIIVQYDEEDVARAALLMAREMLEAAVLGHDYDFDAQESELCDIADHVSLGPSTRSIVTAAIASGIPVRRLNEGSLVQLGWGSAQRKILAAATSQTSLIAEDIVQDKELTRQLLQQVGLPVPRGRPAADAEDAWVAAQELGTPVVVKPRDGNQGRGVAVNLHTREQIIAAYDHAFARGDEVIVEKFAEGDDYRVLIVGKQFVAASRRKPAHVIGDGEHTIAQLVDIENETNPARAAAHAAALSQIKLDDIALSVLTEQGMDPSTVPTKGRQVLIRRNANLSTGGTAVDVTDDVHPSLKAACIEAAQTVGLDVCGIDLMAIDITQPLSARNGVIIELNARPGLRMHLYPSEGKSRDVGRAVIDMMFPGEDRGRIPVVAITGVNGKTTTTRFISHLLRQKGWNVGHTSTDGVFVGSRMLDSGDCSGPKSAHSVLSYPLTDAAVLEVARGGILREGLAFDHCDVAVVTNIGAGDHLGLHEVHTTAQLAKVKQVIVQAVAPTGHAVLNAADPLTAAMTEVCPGKTIFFALDGGNELIREHRLAGGRAVFVRDGVVSRAEGSWENQFIALEEVPLTMGGKITFQVENTLAALAAAWALGIDDDLILAGLRSFRPGFDQNAGRFNVTEINGVTVICDYGHNIDALRSLLDSLRTFSNQRRIVVYSSAGDRRDEDMIEQGRMISTEFDEAWLYEGDYVRGREPGDIMRLLAQGIGNDQRVKRTESILGHLKCVDLAMASAKPGDLLMIQADTADETVAHLRAAYAAK